MNVVHSPVRGDGMPSEKPLLHIVFEPELLERVDDFRFANRFPSRAAAVKWLLTWALNQEPKVTKP